MRLWSSPLCFLAFSGFISEDRRDTLALLCEEKPCCKVQECVALHPRHSDTQTCGKHKRLGSGLRSCGEKMPSAGTRTPISPSSIAGPQAGQDFKRVSWAPKNVQLLTWICCAWKLFQLCHLALQPISSWCPIAQGTVQPRLERELITA